MSILQFFFIVCVALLSLLVIGFIFIGVFSTCAEIVKKNKIEIAAFQSRAFMSEIKNKIDAEQE